MWHTGAWYYKIFRSTTICIYLYFAKQHIFWVHQVCFSWANIMIQLYGSIWMDFIYRAPRATIRRTPTAQPWITLPLFPMIMYCNVLYSIYGKKIMYYWNIVLCNVIKYCKALYSIYGKKIMYYWKKVLCNVIMYCNVLYSMYGKKMYYWNNVP